MIEPSPTGDLSRCHAESFPPKCESNIEELRLSGTEDHLLFMSSTYCTGCQAVCLMAAKGKHLQTGQNKSSRLPVLDQCLPTFDNSKLKALARSTCTFNVPSMFFMTRTPAWSTPTATVTFTRGAVRKSHLCPMQFVCGRYWTQPFRRKNVFLGSLKKRGDDLCHQKSDSGIWL